MAKKLPTLKRPRSTPSTEIFKGQMNLGLPKNKNQKTADGFRNFAMKLGVTGPGQEGGEGGAQNLISEGRYQFNLLTRNRIQLEAAYRGSWIVGRVVDCVAEDMTKSGIIINTNDGAEKIQDFKVQMSRLQIWQRMRDAIAWGRLYGGAIGVMQIDGQDLESELDPETIEEGQFKGIAVYDRWQLNPVLTNVIEEGPDLGLPTYYDIVIGSNINDPGQVPGGQSQTKAGENTAIEPETGQTAGGPNSYGRVRVHHSRCFRTGGHKLPFFQAITEMMWDESIVERMWDRLIEFETATAAVGGLIGRAMLRTVGIDGFRETLSSGGEAKEGLLEQFEYMRMFQTSEGLTLLDKEDNFQVAAYSFAGLSDIIERFGEQLSGSSETPMVRLFGQSPAGLNSSGESDLRNYYDTVYSKQESTMRNPMEIIIKVMWRSCFGEAAPSDLSFTFTPLWQMSAKEKAEITQLNTTSIIAAHGDGLVDTATGMKELKQASADTGTFTHISDEEIDEAEMDEPPAPELEEGDRIGAEAGELGEGPAKPVEKEEVKVGAKDSIWRRWFGRSKDEQSRKDDGKFGSGSGSNEPEIEESKSGGAVTLKLGSLQIHARISEGALIVKGVTSEKSERGKGQGTEAYAALADYAHSKKLELHSDSSVSGEAAKVYSKLEDQGYTVSKNKNTKEEKTSSGKTRLVVPKGEAVFTISGKKKTGDHRRKLTADQKAVRKFIYGDGIK